MLLTSCTDESEPDYIYHTDPNAGLPGIEVSNFTSPAGPGSTEPNLHVSKSGDIHMSWNQDNAFYFSRLNGNEWTKAKRIPTDTLGGALMTNWADFGSLTTLGGDTVVAQYLQFTSQEDFAYDVYLMLSPDGGNTWSTPVSPHTDHTKTEHGFVSMLPVSEGTLTIWLDGRKMEETPLWPKTDEMSLRSVVVRPDGSLSNEAEIDGRVCSCCQTDAVSTGDTAYVVYRDRSADEIRDISLARYVNGAWDEPKTIVNDGWKIAGCPVNGPAIDAHGNRLAVAWYTEADSLPEVRLTMSSDGGNTFATPIIIHENPTWGRVDVKFIADHTVLVSWLETVNDSTYLMARKVGIDGMAKVPVRIALTSRDRSSGFPRVAVSGDRVLIAWTDVGGESAVVKVAALDVAY